MSLLPKTKSEIKFSSRKIREEFGCGKYLYSKAAYWTEVKQISTSIFYNVFIIDSINGYVRRFGRTDGLIKIWWRGGV